jgi:hypothetical protein
MTALAAGGDKKDNNNKVLRRSQFVEPAAFQPGNTSYPFGPTGNNIPLSTGYYFVDSDDSLPQPWTPIWNMVDTSVERYLWRRILPGPRMRDSTFWINNPEGMPFFRNPALPTTGSFYKDGKLFATDSTDDAIAGPIPIGFNFYFDGMRFDSFYVSTNGLIALTNRKYFYDSLGNRTIPPGNTTCYDPMSMDWFVSGARPTGNNGLNDGFKDDYGYRVSVLGGQPTTPTAGIRKRGAANLSGTNFPVANHSTLIAPFFGDLSLSQYNKYTNMVEDWGQVWYKRSSTQDKLVIYILNAAPVRGMMTSSGRFPSDSLLDDINTFDRRPNDPDYLAASCQVVLDRTDSSVTINYGKFQGAVYVNDTLQTCREIFLWNTTVGLRGFPRHVNYPAQPNAATAPWDTEYEQTTYYFNRYNTFDTTIAFPHDSLAIKFKQWKNAFKVASMQFRVRSVTNLTDLCFNTNIAATVAQANNYELLAGSDRLGAIQPIAIIQNLTNNIQGPQFGVNFTPQQVNFSVRYKIINDATQEVVYNKAVSLDSVTLALGYLQFGQSPALSADCNGDPMAFFSDATGAKNTAGFPGTAGLHGIPPYQYARINFPAFFPREYIIGEIGALRGIVSVDPFDPTTGTSLGDMWPFDDSSEVRFYVMKRLNSFYDDVTHFHILDGKAQPSSLMWMNSGAEVVAGSDVSYYPLPPRGIFPAANNADFNVTVPDYTFYKLNSPVIKMNRLDLNGVEEASSTSAGGDEIRSFPIDMRGKQGAVLSLSVQRGMTKRDWPRGWCDQELVGPEPRAVINADMLNPWTELTGGTTSGGTVSLWTDSICVEIAKPSTDGLNGVTNIAAANWRFHPNRFNPTTSIVKAPADYTLLGGGGALRGWLEGDIDSALAYPVEKNTPTKLNGLRPDIFDDGFDFEYQKIILPIPNVYINNDIAAMNFRFRIKVWANNHNLRSTINCKTCIPDDDDPFFVDNIKILFSTSLTDLEVSKVEPVWPYTIAPVSAAVSIPIKVKVSNNTQLSSPTFTVKLRIFRLGDQDTASKALYCRVEQVPFMAGGAETEISMPNWNALNSQTQSSATYRMIANVIVHKPDGSYGDLIAANDTTFTDFTLLLRDVFAYDPPDNPVNDVESKDFTGIPGRGLNLFGVSFGGIGNVSSYGDLSIVGAPSTSLPFNEVEYGAGATGGNGSGSIAVKFKLLQADTIKGYQAFFANMNQAPDFISFAVYSGTDQPAQNPVLGTELLAQRGLGYNQTDPAFEQYVTYLLPYPVILQQGTYWVTLSQLGSTGMELGASRSRSGMRTTSIYIPPPVTNVNYVGGSGYQLLIDKNFRIKNQTGDLINDNYFEYENSKGSGQWAQFAPTVGEPGYAHLHHYGVVYSYYKVPNYNAPTATLSRGTWIPMFRPFLGKRGFSVDSNNLYNPCIEDVVPVELVNFDGVARKNDIMLNWETSSEVNNYGYYVERKTATGTEDWKSIGFVPGAGNSNSYSQYNYSDKNVTRNTTYNYRLRQVDNAGTLSCESISQVITLTYIGTDGLVLNQNYPNPFNASTFISFTLPNQTNVKLEILDVYGNVINTLVNEELNSNNHRIVWNGTDANGNIAPSGTYMYRLITSEETAIGKMTLVR